MALGGPQLWATHPDGILATRQPWKLAFSFSPWGPVAVLTVVVSPRICFLWGRIKGPEECKLSQDLSAPVPLAFSAHLLSFIRKLRWHSFQNSHRPSLNSESLEINRQFAGQIHLLHKGSLLRLTAFMEKYTVPHKPGWVW